jgi:pantoate--beta-alanine ligase
MELIKTIQAVRDAVKTARSKGKKIGFVPTMGALHIGHISLIKEAVKKCDFVVVSIFVNPTQFSPNEDLEKYPRPLDADLDICRSHGADLVFVPDNKEMYPAEQITWVNVEKLTENLCGRSRQSHFRGVLTVCNKLFNIILPDIAFFGQKDAQQTIVIKRMVSDLNMPLEIEVCPTIREADGLAISSRNQYLDARQRQDAVFIYKSLQKAKELIEQGKTDSKEIIAQMQKILNQPGSIEVEYAAVVDGCNLEEIEKIQDKTLIAIAAKIGKTRLIDNIIIDTK